MTLQPTSASSELSVGLETTVSKMQHTSLVAGQWVQLLTEPNPLSSDQALLLCPHGAEQWVTWVPDHGEAIVHRHHLAVLL